MYEDEYYYEARKKENAKLDAELAGDICYRHRWIDWCSVIMLIISAKEI